MTPAEVPVVAVYAGDTCTFPSYTFQSNGTATDLTAAGWGSWLASWRTDVFATDFIPLNIDLSQAAAGIVIISATATQTRLMTGPGVWDIQASRGDEVRTFLRGATTYMLDVTHV